MDEENYETDSEDNIGEGDLSEEDAKINRADAIAKRLEEAAERAEDLIDEIEVSGKASAGKAPEKPKEETPAEYKDRILRGE